MPARWYRFDEGAGPTAADSGTDHEPLTLSSGMGWTTGHTGGDIAIGFDGTAGVDLPAAPELPKAADPRYVACWLQYDGLNDAIILDQGIDGDRTRFLFLCGGDASIAVVFGGGQTVNSGPGVIADGLWHFIECVYDGATLTLKLDGSDIASGSWVLATESSAAAIGQQIGGGDPGSFDVQDWQVWPTTGP